MPGGQEQSCLEGGGAVPQNTPLGYLGPCWYRQRGGHICLLLLGADRIMLTFPSAPLPLAQGKLRVGVFPEQARMQEEVCLGALSAV